MSINNCKRRAIQSAPKLSLTIIFVLLVAPAFAAQDCPNARNFGDRAKGIRADGETRRVRVQATYFRTDDKNAFIRETSDRRWSSSSLLVGTDDFRGKLSQLVARGAAQVNSRRTGALFLGDTAAFDRGSQSLNQNASYFDISTPSLDVARVRALDRYTTFSVFRRPDEEFYRVGLVSWFVEIGPDGGGRMTVDLDAGTFLRPGETQVFKFLSDFEVGRTGDARTYLALTLAPFDGADEQQTVSSVR